MAYGLDIDKLKFVSQEDEKDFLKAITNKKYKAIALILYEPGWERISCIAPRLRTKTSLRKYLYKMGGR